jgi:hypothetical protein
MDREEDEHSMYDYDIPGQVARHALSQSTKPVSLGVLLRLGILLGKEYQLYSSTYFDVVKAQPVVEDICNLDNEGTRGIEWTTYCTGSLRISNKYQYQNDLRGTLEFVGEVFSKGMPYGENWSFKSTNPWAAKLDVQDV